MSKKVKISILLIVILAIVLHLWIAKCYAKHPPQGNAYGHSNPQNPHSCCDNSGDVITTNYEYNNYNDMDYNYDVDQTYNYDQSTNHTDIINNHVTVDNTAIVESLNIRQHVTINEEAHSLLDTQLADAKYYGTPFGMPSIDTDVIYSNFTTLHFNPSQVIAKLGPGEFSQFNITVTSDKPIKLFLSTNRSNIKILNPEIAITRCDGVASAMFIATLEKGTYWTDGLVTFRSESGLDLGSVRVVFENKRAIDHVSRVTMDDTYTTFGHGMRQNRGTWGWSGFVGVRVNRETNKETAYGTLTYDW